MRGLFCCFLMVLTSFVFATPVRLKFSHVPISELVESVYTEILQRDFVLTSDVSTRQDLVTLNLLTTDKTQVKKSLEAALLPLGVEITSEKAFDVIRVKAVSTTTLPEKELKHWSVFVYRPKYRSIQHFVDLLSSVFTGRFTSGGTGGVPSKVSTDTKGNAEPVSSTTSLGRDSDFLIFHGPIEEHKKLKDLLVQVDVPLPELVVNAYLFEVSDLKNDESGIGLVLEKSGFNAVLGTVTKVSNFLSFSKWGIELIAKNLAKDRRFKVVSNPSLVVSSGKSAKIVVGDKVPVKTSAVVDKNGNPVESFEYQQSGVQLDVTPTLRDSGRVNLTIAQNLSQFSPNDFNVQSPTLHNRELSTELSVKSGQTVLLGGLKQSKYTETAQGFTFFPSWKFAKSNETSGTEYVLLIQTDVVSGEME